MIEEETGSDLSALAITDERTASAEEKNCEQMLGAVPIPVGYAGPLAVHFSDATQADIHLPLATTEGALVASVNRGCKALWMSGGVHVSSEYIGITRSLAFKVNGRESPSENIRSMENEWKQIVEGSSSHLKLLRYDLDERDGYIFLTLACDTDEAMGMNMITIAGQALGEWLQERIPELRFVTVAGNVDSDKKPSVRTHDHGRGYRVTAEADISEEILRTILKSDAQAMLDVAEAKLTIGSSLAGAIGKNLHAANIIAALYLATGQDAAHVVEGSLADTDVSLTGNSLHIRVHLPAVIVGVRGGGTGLPAQEQCRNLLLSPETTLKPVVQLAQSIGAAVLAGELSLLAAQASHTLAKAHRELGR